jgi:hypothetical protein
LKNNLKFNISSEYWSSFFPERNVIALAVHPPLVHPTHYTGEPSHVSDTEESKVIDVEKLMLQSTTSDIQLQYKEYPSRMEL